ncbi:MAG: hypothetical protein WCP39_04600 [Chlamydiota bacterium]
MERDLFAKWIEVLGEIMFLGYGRLWKSDEGRLEAKQNSCRSFLVAQVSNMQ